QDGPYGWIGEGISLEVLDANRVVGERARQAVLQAELRLEPALRVGPVGVLEAPRVRPTFDARNRLLPQVMAAHEIEHDVERRMGAAATGILLDGDAGLDDVERRTPVREDARGVVGSWPIEDFQKTLVVLKLAGIGGEIPLGEQRGKEAVARAMTHMQRLRHRTEVRLDAAGERGSDGERGRAAPRVQPQEMTGRRGGAVDAERRGRMPALGVVMEVDAQRKLALGLKARDIGRDEGSSVDRPPGGKRKKSWQDRCRRMPAQGVVAVVEVERMRRGAVDQRR